MSNQSNRKEDNRGPQEQERKTNTAQERKDEQQQDTPSPDPSEMDRHEGKMDNGELGGNLRKEEK